MKEKKRKRGYIVCIIFAVCLVLCISGIAALKKRHTGTHAASAGILKGYSDEINSLGYGIFDRLKTENDNTCISPMSIYITMAMLVNGADGVSRDELMNTLGIENYDEWNSTLEEYIRQSSRADCFIADSVWLGDNIAEAGNIENDFTSPLKKYYNSKVYKNVLFDSGTVKK